MYHVEISTSILYAFQKSFDKLVSSANAYNEIQTLALIDHSVLVVFYIHLISFALTVQITCDHSVTVRYLKRQVSCWKALCDYYITLQFAYVSYFVFLPFHFKIITHGQWGNVYAVGIYRDP